MQSLLKKKTKKTVLDTIACKITLSTGAVNFYRHFVQVFRVSRTGTDVVVVTPVQNIFSDKIRKFHNAGYGNF